MPLLTKLVNYGIGGFYKYVAPERGWTKSNAFGEEISLE
jgi:hypothetical protein